MPLTTVSYRRPKSPPSGRSILTTSAPRSARCRVQNGAATACSSATTRTPSSGYPIRASSDRPDPGILWATVSLAAGVSVDVLFRSWSVRVNVELEVVTETTLTPEDASILAEWYGEQFWSDRPPFACRILARAGDEIVGHLGIGTRVIVAG